MGDVIPLHRPGPHGEPPDPFIDTLRTAAIARHRIVWMIFEGAAENAWPAHMAYIKKVYGY